MAGWTANNHPAFLVCLHGGKLLWAAHNCLPTSRPHAFSCEAACFVHGMGPHQLHQRIALRGVFIMILILGAPYWWMCDWRALGICFGTGDEAPKKRASA